MHFLDVLNSNTVELHELNFGERQFSMMLCFCSGCGAVLSLTMDNLLAKFAGRTMGMLESEHSAGMPLSCEQFFFF